MKITNISIEKSFTLSLQEGYRKVTVKVDASLDSDDSFTPQTRYTELSDFVTERMKEEKAKFTK
jgi:hypothetical protein